MPELVHATPECTAGGHLNAVQLQAFYRGSRFVVVPSRWFEVCPLSVLEAMAQGLPVIASRIGSLEGMVEDGVTGLLFEPAMLKTWPKDQIALGNNDLSRRMGLASRMKAQDTYTAEAHYEKLMTIYNRAVQIKRHER